MIVNNEWRHVGFGRRKRRWEDVLVDYMGLEWRENMSEFGFADFMESVYIHLGLDPGTHVKSVRSKAGGAKPGGAKQRKEEVEVAGEPRP